MCESLHVAVKMYITTVFLHLYLLFYYRGSLQLMQYALWYTQVRFDRELNLSSHVTSSVTWPFTCPWPVSYRCPLVLTLYLQGILRYFVFGSRFWPF